MASQPTTIGPVRNATIPTLHAVRSATAAKSPDPAVAASAATVVDGITADSETTAVVTDASTTAEADETTEADAITTDPSEARSTTTTGPVRNATTPTSRSETSATVAKPPDRVVAVAVVNEVEVGLPTAANATTGVKVVGTETIVVTEVEVGLPTAANAAEETEGSEMADAETAVTEDKVAPKVVEAMAHGEGEAHNVVALPMEASEGPKASVLAMPITAHHVISERLVPLNERKTERT